MILKVNMIYCAVVATSCFGIPSSCTGFHLSCIDIYIYTNIARLGQRVLWQCIKEPTSSHNLHFIVWGVYGLRYDNKYACDPTQGSVLPVIFVARGNGILMNSSAFHLCLMSIYGNWVLCHPPTEMVFVALHLQSMYRMFMSKTAYANEWRPHMHFSAQYISNKNLFMKDSKIPLLLGACMQDKDLRDTCNWRSLRSPPHKTYISKLVGYGLLYDFQNVCLTGTHTCMMCVSLVLIPV